MFVDLLECVASSPGPALVLFPDHGYLLLVWKEPCLVEPSVWSTLGYSLPSLASQTLSASGRGSNECTKTLFWPLCTENWKLASADVAVSGKYEFLPFWVLNSADFQNFTASAMELYFWYSAFLTLLESEVVYPFPTVLQHGMRTNLKPILGLFPTMSLSKWLQSSVGLTQWLALPCDITKTTVKREWVES